MAPIPPAATFGGNAQRDNVRFRPEEKFFETYVHGRQGRVVGRHDATLLFFRSLQDDGLGDPRQIVFDRGTGLYLGRTGTAAADDGRGASPLPALAPFGEDASPRLIRGTPRIAAASKIAPSHSRWDRKCVTK